MKKIITLLLFVGCISGAAFAQQGRRQQNGSQTNNRNEVTSYSGNNHANTNSYPGTTTYKDYQLNNQGNERDHVYDKDMDQRGTQFKDRDDSYRGDDRDNRNSHPQYADQRHDDYSNIIGIRSPLLQIVFGIGSRH